MPHRALETVEQALASIRERGVLPLTSVGGSASLVELVAGRPVKGSWTDDPAGERILAIATALEASPEVLVLKLVGGKVTFAAPLGGPAGDGDRSAGLAELAPMRGEPRPLEREHEAFRRLGMPAAEARRFLRAVEGAVDLDRGQLPAGVFELARLRQVFRIERAAPGREHPAADADPDHGHRGLQSSAPGADHCAGRQPVKAIDKSRPAY